MSRWVKFDTATSQLTVVSAETFSAIDTSAARVAASPMVPSSRSSVSGYLPATEWISEGEDEGEGEEDRGGVRSGVIPPATVGVVSRLPTEAPRVASSNYDMVADVPGNTPFTATTDGKNGNSLRYERGYMYT